MIGLATLTTLLGRVARSRLEKIGLLLQEKVSLPSAILRVVGTRRVLSRLGAPTRGSTCP